MQDVVVGVTAGRRAEQLAGALERRGARTVVGPTVGGDEPVPDADLAVATDVIVAAAPDWLVANTGAGMRLWIDAAERTGRLLAFRALVERARCVARGAKAVSGLRRLGVEPEWIPDGQTDAEVVRRLRCEAEEGQTVAVQLHGSPTSHPYGDLRSKVSVLTITPYLSVLPEDLQPAQELIARTLAGDVDVVTFTSPSAVRGLFTIAEQASPEQPEQLRHLFRERVAVAAIGSVTRSALEGLGVAVTIVPLRPRNGALVSAIEEWTAARLPRA
ncbi:MAG TPA: uroporphyrinogen-III synthase [Nitriliruptorales bacterium]